MSSLFSPMVLVTFLVAVLLRFLAKSLLAEIGGRRRDGVCAAGQPKPPDAPTALPVVTSTGRVLKTVEELDERLEMLRDELRHKEEKLASSEAAIKEAERGLRKMRHDSRRLARQYSMLDVDVRGATEECRQLRREIGEYVERRGKARREFDEGLKYYTRMLSDESLKDFEVVPRGAAAAEGAAKTPRREIVGVIEKYRIL